MDELVVGIDLGTTFTSGAVQVGDRVELLLDGRGEPCFPSVVHFPRHGPPVVGFEADAQRAVDPLNTVTGIKRLLGRGGEPEALRLLEATSAVRFRRHSQGAVELMVRTGGYSPVELASILFRHVRDRARLRFGDRVGRAVITVPVTASEAARRDTAMAAQVAGFEVLDVVAEPIAGAASVGLDRFEGHRFFVAYDFGGGTFDVSVIEQDGDVLRPLASGGDDSLGGDDFDDALARRVSGVVWHGQRVDLTRDVVKWDTLRRRAESAKRALSRVDEVRLSLDSLVRQKNALALALRRQDADALWGELVARSVETTARTLLESGLRPPDLAGILMVGGTTLVRLVRERLSAVFGTPFLSGGDPQTMVAVGAAAMGARALAA